MNRVKNPFAYTGGKYDYLEKIEPVVARLGEITTLGDHFCGSCDLLNNIPARYRFGNDTGEKLIEMLRTFTDVTVDHVGIILHYVNEYGLSSSASDKANYYTFRDDYNTAPSPHKLATLVLHAYNNLIRFNKKGQYNVPFGLRGVSPKKIATLKEYIERLQQTQPHFTTLDFLDIDYDLFDLNLFDPPYLISEAVYNKGWDEDYEYKLYDLLDRLDRLGKPFLLTNVLQNKGLTNQILLDWLADRDYNVVDLKGDYSKCNANRQDNLVTVEVMVTNF